MSVGQDGELQELLERVNELGGMMWLLYAPVLMCDHNERGGGRFIKLSDPGR